AAVDGEDLHLDLVAGGDDLAGVVDAPGPGHLGDVDEALDAGFELDEGAVAHDVDDLAGVPAADAVLGLHFVPRAQSLQPQRDLVDLPFLADASPGADRKMPVHLFRCVSTVSSDNSSSR